MQLYTTPVVKININHLELDEEDSFGDAAFWSFEFISQSNLMEFVFAVL